MEVTQFTYFQEVGGLACKPVLGEITYGLERLAMYLQGKDSVSTTWCGRRASLTATSITRTRSSSRSYNFELSNTEMLFRHFGEYEGEAKRLIEAQCVLPGYEMVMKCLAHLQPARRARRDLGHRARGLYRSRARTGAQQSRRRTTSRASGSVSRWLPKAA